MKNKVFISYKNTINGVPTKDSKMAEELHGELVRSGINTFFADKTLLEFGTDQYKDQIDAELDECIVLVVVGTSVENILSRWVKYEWDGFQMDILNGCKKGKVFTYVDDINPHALPRALRGVQCFDKKKEPLSKIVEFIKNAINSIESKEADPDREQNAIKSEGKTELKENVDAWQEAYNLSASFLHSGATQIKASSLECVEKELAKMSSLFEDIHQVKHRDEVIPSADVAQTIYDIIVKSVDSKNSKLLKIKGPLGSYKIRLLQYLYLLFEKKEIGILPFYIDVAMYEKATDYQNSSDKKLEYLVHDHFSRIKNCVKNMPEYTPVIIIDGVRDFSSGRDSLYTLIKSELSGMDCKLIISMDTDFTFNPKNKFTLHPLAGTDFEYFIRINSLSTYYKEKSIRFIQNCIDIFQINMPYEGVDASTIYDKLVNLGVISLDAYWLKNLLSEMLGNILNPDISIADLYESICLRDVDAKMLSEASKLAYEYEYGNIDFRDSDFFFDKRWKIIRKHRTVLEYLMAKYYIARFKELDYNNSATIQEQLRFFTMVLPKSLVLFIKPMLNKIDDYENKVYPIALNYYESMTSFERNQLVYWLGRMKSRARIEECNAFLKEKWTEQRNQYFNGKSQNVNRKKNDAFLYRTLSVSLIAQGDKEVAKDYFDSLLNDKMSNEINRGFHLAYYGDIHYIPNKTMLDLYDDPKFGISTFDTLCVSIETKKKAHIFNFMLILDLFTACSLLQTRLEANDKKGWLAKYKPYAIRTIENLKWILSQRRMNEFEDIKMYYEWMLDELTKYFIDGEVYYSASVLNIIEKAKNVNRTGWINRKVPDPENIIEHMYSCWFIGAFFLPDHSEVEGYDKNTILNMLLIHDLGESETGDIPRPEKKYNKGYYDEQENAAIQPLFLSRTYPGAVCVSQYANCWNSWYNAKDINAAVAKDIDVIQALYQYCCYYMEGKIATSDDDMQSWFDELYEINTHEGRTIAEKLILKNPVFEKLVGEFGRTMEEYYG